MGDIVFAAKDGNTTLLRELLKQQVDSNTPGHKDKETALHWVVYNRLFDVFDLLIEAGANVNAQNRFGNSVLNWAAWGGSLRMVCLLIERGASIWSLNDEGMTVLMRAAEHGHVSIVRFLIGLGADVSAKDRNGKTALDYAKGNRHVSVATFIENGFLNPNVKNMEEIVIAAKESDAHGVIELLEKGADPNSREKKEHDTCLHWAVYNELREVAELLIEKGADVNASNRHGNSVINWAAWAGSYRMTFLLADNNADINARNQEYMTPLMRAAEQGHLNVVRLLIKLGAPVNAKDHRGRVAADYAAEKHHEKVLAYLKNISEDKPHSISLKNTPELVIAVKDNDAITAKNLLLLGADPNSREPHDLNTCLHWAAYNCIFDVVEDLLFRGANINATNRFGNSVLNWAAWSGNVRMVQLLVDNGADVNGTNADEEKMTVLMRAAEQDRLNVVRRLVALGANIDAVDVKGKTASTYAAEKHYDNIVNFLKFYKSLKLIHLKNNEQLVHAAEKLDTHKVHILLGEGALPDSRESKDQNTCMHWASYNGMLDVVETLLDRGASVDLKNKHGNTPLNWAAWAGICKVVQTMVDNGADIDAVNEGGQSILMRAAEQGHLEVVMQLVKLGANVTARDNNGKTAADLAAEKRHDNVVTFLKAVISVSA